jgi:hypothetical protein
MQVAIGKAVQALVMLLTVVVNGQPAANQVPALEHEGKAYVEAVAFAQALGGQASYDRQSKRLMVTLPRGTGVMGTQQMAGEWAVMGQQYTLNEGDPLNFMLNSAEFSVARLNVGDTSVVAQGDEKLLVLHMTIQNPQSRTRRVYWADLEFTAVDAMNVNREWSQELGIESTRQPVDMDLKPAQRLDLYTAIVVPAKGVVPKLIVKSGEGNVLRYDLRQVVAPLAAPFADPNDASGATALTKIDAKKDAWYPMGLFDVTFEGAEIAAVDDDGDPPEEGEGFVVIKVRMRNGSADEERLYSDPFEAALRTTDGEKVEWDYEMLHPSRGESVDADLDPGDEMGARLFFRAPAGVRLDRCELSEGDEGRVYVFGLGGMAVPGGGGGTVGDALDQITDSALGGLF